MSESSAKIIEFPSPSPKLKNSAESQLWSNLLHEFWPKEFDQNGDEVVA
jgi:hypothetical protein